VRPRLDDDVAEWFEPRREEYEVGAAIERGCIVAPAEKADAVGDPEIAGLRSEARFVWAVAGDPQIRVRELLKREERDVVRFAGVKATHAEEQRDALWRVEVRPAEFCAVAGGGEIRNVVGAVFRPAFADDPIDNVLGVADERIEIAIVLEFVVAA
jgi:hypothetical protein